jgi:hypothetical protein
MSYESPASILFDVNGIAMAITGGFEVPVSTSALLMGGMTSTGTGSYLLTEPDGTLHITGSFTTTGIQQVTGTVAIQGITNVSGAFPVFISASNLLTVTGSVSVLNPVTVNQGNSGSIAQSWYTQITNGTNVIGTGSSAPIFTQDAVLTGSSVTSIVSTTSVVALIPSASQTRRGVTIYNDANKTMTVLYGSGTVNSTTNFSIKVAAGGYLEVPDEFNGPIYAIWANSSTGNALVTEFFP